MGTVRFEVDAIRPLFEHARAANAHQPTFGEMCDHDPEWDGCSYEGIEPEVLSAAAGGAGLHLVKDNGIYLMSNGKPRQMRNPNDPDELGKKSLVVYGAGFDPDDGAHVWDRCRDCAGGDDFVEALERDLCEQIVASPPGSILEVEFRGEQMRFSLSMPRPPLRAVH